MGQKEGFTTIGVRLSTWNRLSNLRTIGRTFDSVVNDLLNAYEREIGGSG